MDNIIVNRNDYFSWLKVNGFWFNYCLNQPDNNAIVIRTSINMNDDYRKKFLQYLDKFQESNFIMGHKNSGEKYIIVIPSTYSEDKIKELLLSFSNTLLKIDAIPACAKCGKDSRQGFVLENDVPIVVCHHCQEEISEPHADDIREKKKNKKIW